MIIALVLIWYFGKYFNINTQAIQGSLKTFPLFYSAALYILLYVIVTFFIFFSKDVFWLMGAVLFGPWLSTLFICIAESINAFILFHLARYLGRGYVEQSLLEKHKDLDEKLGRISFFWLFIFRAAPLIPYRFMDLAAGLTKINFRRYLVCVIFASPVKMLWIQYILFGVGNNIFHNPNVLVGYFLEHKALLLFSLIYIVLVIAVIFKIRTRD